MRTSRVEGSLSCVWKLLQRILNHLREEDDMDQFGEATSPQEHSDVCPVIRKVSRDRLEEELIECVRA